EGLAHAREASRGEVQVVNEEEDYAAAPLGLSYRLARARVRRLQAARGRELRLLVRAPGPHALEEGERQGASVNLQLELLGPKVGDEAPALVHDRHVGLD